MSTPKRLCPTTRDVTRIASMAVQLSPCAKHNLTLAPSHYSKKVSEVIRLGKIIETPALPASIEEC